MKFRYQDGTILTPAEMGDAAFRWSTEMAGNWLNSTFATDQPAATLPIAAKILSAPAMGHLYISAYHAGAYACFVFSVLKADAHVQAQFIQGLKHAVQNLRDFNGKSLHPSVQDVLARASLQTASHLHTDLAASIGVDPKQFNPRGSKACEFILDILQATYPAQNSPQQEGLQRLVLVNLLTQAPINLMTILSKQWRLIP